MGVTTNNSAAIFASLKGYFNNNTGSILSLNGGIYSNSAGVPGTLLQAFNTVAVPAGSPTTQYSLTTTAPYTLLANTAYWFVEHDIPGGIFWDIDSAGSTGTAPTAAAGFTPNGFQKSSNSGTSWSADTTFNPTVQIDVTAVPEPSAIMLVTVGVIGLAGLTLRRRSSLIA